MIYSINTFKPHEALQQHSKLLKLNNDILIHILQYLQGTELIKLRLVSIQLRQFVCNSTVWKYVKVNISYNDDVMKHFNVLSWYLSLHASTPINMDAIFRDDNSYKAKQCLLQNPIIAQQIQDMTTLVIDGMEDLTFMIQSFPALLSSIQYVQYNSTIDIESAEILKLHQSNIKILHIHVSIDELRCCSDNDDTMHQLEELHDIKCVYITLIDDSEFDRALCKSEIQRLHDTIHNIILKQNNFHIVATKQSDDMKTNSFDYKKLNIKRVQQ